MRRLLFVACGAVVLTGLFGYGPGWLISALPADWSGPAKFGIALLAAFGVMALFPLADSLRPAPVPIKVPVKKD